MNKKRALFAATGLAVLVAVPAVVAAAGPPTANTFVAVLNAAEEVPHCDAATNAARGVVELRVVDNSTGEVDYKLMANNLPGDIIAAHIHIAPLGVAGPIVQGFALIPGAENGVVGSGSFTNPALVAAIRANPDEYYVNVHTAAGLGCPPGVIRGQLDDHGPSNNA